MTLCVPGITNDDFLQSRRRSSSAGVADLMPIHCCVRRRDGLALCKKSPDGSEYCGSCGADQIIASAAHVVYYGSPRYKRGKSKGCYIKPPWKEEDEEDDTPAPTAEEKEAKYIRRVETVYGVATRLRSIGDEVLHGKYEQIEPKPISMDYWSILHITTDLNSEVSVMLLAITFAYLVKKRRADTRLRPIVE